MAEPVGGRLSAALRETVEKAGVSQIEIAERLGVDQPTVSRWVRGMRRPPLDILATIEDMAGVQKGTVLRVAGYVDDDLDVITAVNADPELSDAARKVVLGVYEGLRKMSAIPARDSNTSARASARISARSTR